VSSRRLYRRHWADLPIDIKHASSDVVEGPSMDVHMDLLSACSRTRSGLWMSYYFQQMV